jgi:guanylate kinase
MRGNCKLFVFSAPSGAGKTTIAKAALASFPKVRFSISATTRPQRPGEVHGKDYFFLTREEFRKKQESGELVEWEEVFLNYYGTLKSEIDKALAQGEHMLFDVDVKGALSIKAAYPEDAILIFIRPPSLEELERRLSARKTEDAETIARRLARAEMELTEGKRFDHTVVNDDLERATDEVCSLIRTYDST